MKLKKLEIVGFKSFPDKAAIEFPPGISAVVGPNGCGKSNIVDAMRWVMGEQSVKQLRGKSMEDVIFSGAKGKPPLNMAEVSLTLLNDNGSAPEELRYFSEINVTRRLFRSGESAYYINRQPCRLKDIHNIFMGTGMGAKTYAVIQQGNIGAITDAGPDERRLFIEEAAGVTRYKNRKKEALRKVASTHQNLLRVNDIITEVQRQMNGLKRQARKAERFKKYKKHTKELNIRLGIHYYDDYTVKIQKTEDLLQQYKDTDIQHTSQLKRIDAAVEDVKLKRWKKDQEITNQKSHQFETQRKIDRMESDIEHQRAEIERLAHEVAELISAKETLEDKNADIIEEIDVVQNENHNLVEERQNVTSLLNAKQEAYRKIRDRVTRLNQRLEENKTALMDMVAQEARYKNTYQNASNNKENIRKRQQRIEQETDAAQQHAQATDAAVGQLQSEIDELKNRRQALDGKIQASEKRVQKQIEALRSQIKLVQTVELEGNQIRSQLSALQKMDQSYAWYRDGVKSIMRLRETDGDHAQSVPEDNAQGLAENIVGLMAEVLDPEPAYASAVESVLGEALQYVIVENQQTGIAAIDYLQAQGTGRSGFIPAPHIKPLFADSGDEPESSRSLLNHVSVKTGFEHIARAILGHVVVVDDMPAALDLFNKNGRSRTIVTKDGNMISHQGVFIGGSKEKLSGILTKKQELKTLARQAQKNDQKLAAAREKQPRMEKELRELEDALQKQIEKKNLLLQESVEKEKNLYRLMEELKHARRHLDILRLEKEQLAGEENDIDVEIEKHNRAIAEIESKVQNAQQSVTTTNTSIQEITSELESINQEVIDLRLKLTSHDASIENSENTLRRLREFWQDGLSRLDQLARDIAAKNQKQVQLKENLERFDQELALLYGSLNKIEASLKTFEADYLAIDAELQKNDGIIAHIQHAREGTLQKIRMLELEQSQQTIKRENVANRLQEQYHQPITFLKTQIEALFQNTDVSVEQMEVELEKFRLKISRIGDVNLGAIEEFDELKTRFDFLAEQRDDLEKAIEDLHKVIKKINRITQERFSTTFDAVNEKLKEVFPRLFEGGSAKLVLTDPDNALESGVEFMIHPPGKKLTRMSLLSGGEKALSAIAFIFSIFLIKPTSFCLMDEIDAPLDDANVFRFNDLLKVIGRKSQIIMITHNKRSMEFADTLFGITMGEKGVSKIVSVNFEKQAN